MDLHNDLHINSITETYSNRFGVKKITCSVRLTGPDIIGALDCLIQKVVNNTDDYFKVGLSISTNKSNLYIEFRPKDSLTGKFLLNRFEKLAQSGYNLFACNTDYIFIFTLLSPRKKNKPR
ncbi:unnamed protein product [Rotaria magnacalcarata]|uniref:Uncharacterized protein n=1 Tax=Rotaria magnacalcarata TaxID=392030 RepID=A0A816V414_9BILA|nr:unnamed protein product [Rotaria magnacalcarata]